MEQKNLLQYYRDELNWNTPFANIMEKYAPDSLRGYLTMRQSLLNAHLPKQYSELIFSLIDTLDGDLAGAKAHAHQALDSGITMPQLVEGFMIFTLVKGINFMVKGGTEVLEDADNYSGEK